MALLPLPKPSKNAWNPDRPMSSLLKWQIEHLHAAEMRMPLRYRTEIYVNALRTEGEASNYIEAVTEAIRQAHADAEAAKVRAEIRAKRPVRRPIEIAAVADEAAELRMARKAKAKKKSAAKKKAKR
jgi:hypothetical protein